jgi:RNA polymerase sigma-70 factor (ECF subfamily)
MKSLSALTDNELLHLLKQDDEPAFAEIYHRYATNIAEFAGSKLYSLEDARDIIHDVFVKLWVERKTLVVTSNLKTYLYTIVRYKVIDRIRRNATDERYKEALQSLANWQEASAEHRLAAKELEKKIRKTVDELPPKTREVYLLSREEHYTVRDIAEKLNVSEQTVKNQITSALKRLRDSLLVLLLIIDFS